VTFDRLKIDLTEFPAGKRNGTGWRISLKPFNPTEEVYFAMSRATSLHNLQVIGFHLEKVRWFVFFS
jgi:hypothetical protein